MKTTDGHELNKGNYYYLENGQEIMLKEAVKTMDEKIKYLVIPFYVGETIETACHGGEHREYTMLYEHEGEEILVDAIFKNVPLEKITEKYKRELEKIESLKKEEKRLWNNIKTIRVDIKIETESLLMRTKEVKNAKRERERLLSKKVDVDNEYITKTLELSHLQDSIDNLEGEKRSEELAELRRREFKLACLENGGVDNWEWFEESLKDYRERYPD
jgi:hypothetical protein